MLFFQFQIKLSNRNSVLRSADKQKSSIGDKLTAETLHSHTDDIEPNEQLVKSEETLSNLNAVLAKLSDMSDEYFLSLIHI